VTTAPPDLIAALPRGGFEVSAQACEQADAIIAQPPQALFRRLLNDQESEAVHLVARRILDAFLPGSPEGSPQGSPEGSPEGGPEGSTEGPAGGLPADATAGDIAAHVGQVRAALAATAGSLRDAEPDARAVVLRQRAPIGLLGGCWLDVLSQPATQPSVIVNRLFAQHFTLRGQGNPRRSLHHLRRTRLEQAGIFLPDLAAADFLDQAAARPLTALHACFYLALSRLPATFLPELVGVHYAHLALGVDDLLSGTSPVLPEPELRDALAAYLELAGPEKPAERERLHAGLRLAVDLEREHVAMLAELAAWHRGLSLESKVAAIVARHAPYARTHHTAVRIGGRPLADMLTDPDLASFLAEFREAEPSRFVKAIKFGGPMFGIFDSGEAATFQAWVETVQAGERPPIVITPCTAGDARARERAAAIAASAPADLVIADPGAPGDRALFHRLVNIENYPNTRPLAARRAEKLFAEAEILFSCGAAGRYTDASYFDYTPEALYDRADRVYREKLVEPYRPLEVIPDRDVVVFLQSTYALGALVDAAWIHRVANLGRDERPCDAALFAIYADEMGHGDLRKNHITLIHRALRSMDIDLPHIRDAAFMEQDELPDDLYGFSLHQLCMALFPDTFFNEILGYNLAIEMFGLGELRLHEIQKMRHYGFDDCYERAHLTIDNLSAGHSRQAADIIVSHLDQARRAGGDAAVQREWRRVWRGYASLAYFVEHALVKQVTSEPVDMIL
jgi:Iron-containing redox enzyme